MWLGAKLAIRCPLTAFIGLAQDTPLTSIKTAVRKTIQVLNSAISGVLSITTYKHSSNRMSRCTKRWLRNRTRNDSLRLTHTTVRQTLVPPTSLMATVFYEAHSKESLVPSPRSSEIYRSALLVVVPITSLLSETC